MPLITDPHQMLVLTAVRSCGLAFSALPDAPVLPMTESRRARLARRLGRRRARAGSRLLDLGGRARATRPAVATEPAVCR